MKGHRSHVELRVPVRNVPWANKAYQSIPKKLNIAGIFHTHCPEKDSIGGGVTEHRTLTCRFPN